MLSPLDAVLLALRAAGLSALPGDSALDISITCDDGRPSDAEPQSLNSRLAPWLRAFAASFGIVRTTDLSIRFDEPVRAMDCVCGLSFDLTAAAGAFEATLIREIDSVPDRFWTPDASLLIIADLVQQGDPIIFGDDDAGPLRMLPPGRHGDGANFMFPSAFRKAAPPAWMLGVTGMTISCIVPARSSHLRAQALRACG